MFISMFFQEFMLVLAIFSTTCSQNQCKTFSLFCFLIPKKFYGWGGALYIQDDYLLTLKKKRVEIVIGPKRRGIKIRTIYMPIVT
jgi:hypothetical protein